MRNLLGLVMKLATFWQKEVNTLKHKLSKALEPKVTFVVDPTKFKRALFEPYTKYNFVIKDSNSESHSHRHLACHYCCIKGHTISK